MSANPYWHRVCPSRKKPLVIFVFVFGFSILGFIRSSQTLSSTQDRDKEFDSSEGTFHQFEEESDPEVRDRRPSHDDTVHWDSSSGSSSSSQHFWEKEEDSSCFHVDQICHDGNRGGEWFYDKNGANDVSSHMQLHQPSITYSNEDIPDEYEPDERYYFNVTSPSALSSHNRSATTTLSCAYSSTPYHLIVQSKYNDMIGEFYSRTVRGLNEWMRDYPPKSENDIQLYVHFASKGRQTLYHGHRLFLGALPQNDQIDSFLSLIQSNGRCQCFHKLVFCGYNVEEDEDNVDSTAYFYTADSVKHIYTDVSCVSGGFRRGNRCTAYNHLRQDLLSRYERKDPLLHTKVREYRHQILLNNGVPSQDIGSVDEWKIIGLTDRKARRVWLNINEIVHACKDNFLSKKVICIKVNVEETNSVEAQLLMHMSLNSLVGVHGAQLTHGVLIPPEGFILELLPWIPRNISDWGEWVDVTDRPTPLGEIFHGTSLNHLGVRLGRESVPLCEQFNWSDIGLKACLLNETNDNNLKFEWDNRDFNVDVDIVDKFISLFLLKDIPSCGRTYKRAEENDFVIYNTYCSEEGEDMKYAKQYFHRRSRARKYQSISRQ